MGISVAAVVATFILALFLYAGIYRKKKVKTATLLLGSHELSAGQGNFIAIMHPSLD